MTRRGVLVISLGCAAVAVGSAAFEIACVPSLHDAEPCTYDCLGGACVGGACQPFEIFEKQGSDSFVDLAINSDSSGDVLYAASSDDNVYAITLAAPFVDGGAAEAIDPDCKNASQIAVDNGHVLWTCKGNATSTYAKIGRRKSNSDGADVFYQADASAFSPVGIAAQNNRVAWISDVGDSGAISEMGSESPDPSTDTTIPERPGRMAAANAPNGSVMFLAGTTTENKFSSGIVYDIEPSGATALNPSGPKAYEFVAVTGTPTVLFGVQDVSSDNGQAPVLVRQSLPNGAAASIPLGTDPGHGYGVALDADGGTVFVVTTDTTQAKTGRVFRVRTASGADAGAELVATSAAGADRVVYWARENAVVWSTHDNTKEQIFGIALRP